MYDVTSDPLHQHHAPPNILSPWSTARHASGVPACAHAMIFCLSMIYRVVCAGAVEAAKTEAHTQVTSDHHRSMCKYSMHGARMLAICTWKTRQTRYRSSALKDRKGIVRRNSGCDGQASGIAVGHRCEESALNSSSTRLVGPRSPFGRSD